MKNMILALLLAAPASAAPSPEPEILMKRSEVVWGFDFLPDGKVVFTERAGFLGVLDPATGKVQELKGAPKVWAKGQGGLLDVKAHGDWLYLTWSHPVEGGAATALGRGKVRDGKLVDFETLLLTNAGGKRGEHFGSRLLFDGPHLYMTVGERGQRDESQKLERHNGKVLRLTHEGKPAGSGVSKALPEVWSWGHRNPQGIDKRPATEQVWEVEFGPRGGDELNLLKAQANYGWPKATYGREYWGPRIGAEAVAGTVPPVEHWSPVISPSGMAFLEKDRLAVACLNPGHLRLITLEGERVAAQTELYADKGWRFRQVRKGPDGKLWFSTDEGRLGKVPRP
jgi:glucose/arabinose dehydrogenase